jgi:copper chaperone
MSETLTLTVPGMHCGHCEASVKEEVSVVPGVESVVVDLDLKLVTVSGEALDEVALRAAVEVAGYDVTAAA